MSKKSEMVTVSRKDLVNLLAYNQEAEEKNYEENKDDMKNPDHHIWITIKKLADQAGHKFT